MLIRVQLCYCFGKYCLLRGKISGHCPFNKSAYNIHPYKVFLVLNILRSNTVLSLSFSKMLSSHVFSCFTSLPNFLRRLLVLLTIKQGLSKIQKQIKKIMLLMPPVSPPPSRHNTLEKKQVRRRHTGSCHLGQSGSGRAAGRRSRYLARVGGSLASLGSYLTGCLASLGSYLTGSRSYLIETSSYLGGAGSYLAQSRDYLTRSVSSYLSWPADQLEVVEEAYLLQDMS